MRRLASLALTAAAACHSNGAPPDADEALACIAAGRGETYAVGLTHTGATGALTFKLMSATPAPPGFNDNTWVVELSAAGSGSGTPVTGATITVTPFMPDHQHGTGIKAKVEAMATPGQYKIAPINLWMPGYWEITLDVQAGSVHDSSVFKFCIQA